MLDWLKRDPREEPSVAIGEHIVPVIIRRHPRAKRMTLRLSQDGKEVRITIPSWGRTAEALDFARSRQHWLARQMAALPQPMLIETGSAIPFRGEPLRIEHAPESPRKPVRDGNVIRLGGPNAALAARLRRWLENEARGHLSDDLEEYCDRAGQMRPRLALSNARRRWGSCAPDGAIRINWRLIMAPDFVRRSVVAHEVTHLVHFDHSPRFHTLLSDLYEGDIGAANDWLKRDGRGLYLPFG